MSANLQYMPSEAATGAPLLFSPVQLRGITARNRIMVSPMDQYCANNGHTTDWHFAHLTKFSMGGAGIVFMESTKVERRGLSSLHDAGIWSDEHVPRLKAITDFVRTQGAVPGIQLGHAGRKAGVQLPWEGFGPLDRTTLTRSEDRFEAIGPSAIAAFDGWPVPHAMSVPEIRTVVGAWGQAARRAHTAGFDIIEIHGAHGYLIHQFLSPAANQRTDNYGGSLTNRMRFAVEVVESIRKEWHEDKPLFFRVSAVDEAGWTLDDSVTLAILLKKAGVDVFDCSSGGIGVRSPTFNAISRRMGFQVPYAARIRDGADIATVAVGLITQASQAELILSNGQADIVALAREFLYNPNWPIHAAQELGVDPFQLLPNGYGWWLDRRAKAGIES